MPAPPEPREPEIALVLSPDTWVEVLHRHCADHGGARVRCIVVEPAVAIDEEYAVLVATDRWSAFTRPFVESIHQRGRRILVVVDADDPGARDRAAQLGIDEVIVSSASPDDLVSAVVTLAETGRGRHPDATRRIDAVGVVGIADMVGVGSTPERCRTLIAVGGPFGAGSTEVASGIAAASARRGDRSVVVDADQVTPSVAARLGLPVEPNLCSAVDAVAYGLGAVPGALFDLGNDWPAVLVGAPSRESADSLRSRDVVAVADVLAERYAPVGGDVSAGAPVQRERSVAASIVARAAAVVAVGSATPVGVIRLLEWLGTVDAFTEGGSVYAVVNRAPNARSRRAELSSEILGGGRIAGLTFIPSDPRVDDAVWDASIAERGPFARAADDVLQAVRPLLDESSGRTRRRR
jgi:flagellar biosynthesis protein FlhG